MNSALMLHKHAHPAVAGLYLVGAVLGALVTGAILLIVAGVVSPVPAALRASLYLLVCALLLLHALRLLCLPLPQRSYQIPRETFAGSARRAAFRFAAELGLGFRTYVPAASPYALAGAVLLVNGETLPHAVLGATLAAVGFGLGRARIVAGHAVRGSVAVDHPEIWLRMADGVSLVILASVGVRALLA